MMKANQVALSAYYLIAMSAVGTSCSSAFVPNSLRQKQWGQPKTTAGTTTTLTTLFDSFDGWMIPGKPIGHPDHSNEHIIHLTVGREERQQQQQQQQQQDMPRRREVARSNIEPLAEDTGDDEAAYEQSRVQEEETTMLPTTIEGDARLNALLEEARFLAEEVKMRVEEEQALQGWDDVERNMHSRQPVPLITDPESILGAEQDNKFAPLVDADDSGRMVLSDNPEELEEEERMRRNAEEAAKRFRADAARINEEEAEAQEEMRRRGVQEAKRMKAEAVRIRAQKEEAGIRAEIEARREAIEAAIRMKEQAFRRTEEFESQAWAQEEARYNAAEESQVYQEERAQIEAEGEARIFEEEKTAAGALERIRAAEDARLEGMMRIRAEANDRRLEAENARVDTRRRAEEEARRFLAETARIRNEREDARMNAEAEARQQGIEAARRMREETARRADERNAQLWAKDESRQKAKEDAIRRVEDRERMIEEEEARMQAQMAEEERKWRAEDNGVTDEEQESAHALDKTNDGSEHPDEETMDRPQPYAISDVMRIIG
jgi:hypothetical protein